MIKTIKVPCVVGDYIYAIGLDGDNEAYVRKECVVDVSTRRVWTDRTNSDGYNFSALGITFFLSQEEAENAVKRENRERWRVYLRA